MRRVGLTMKKGLCIYERKERECTRCNGKILISVGSKGVQVLVGGERGNYNRMDMQHMINGVGDSEKRLWNIDWLPLTCKVLLIATPRCSVFSYFYYFVFLFSRGWILLCSKEPSLPYWINSTLNFSSVPIEDDINRSCNDTTQEGTFKLKLNSAS